MSAQPEETDPFGDAEKSPALSFKDKPIGTTYTGIVTGAPKTVQQRNFDTGEPDFWPVKNVGETPNPKMAVVINIEIDGEPFSVWAPKPSSMFTAIGAARKEAGQLIAVGGQLAIRLTGEKPNDNPNKHPQKLYAARYTPGAPPAEADPWATAAPVASAAPVATGQTNVASAAPVAAAPWDDAPPF